MARRKMDLEAIHDITRRYSPLDQMIREFFSSSNATAPSARLEVGFGTAVADASFEGLDCFTADGVTSRLRSRDGKMEARQLTRLLSYDRRLRRLGTHSWAPGPPGTPKDVLGKGAFGRRATDFALVIHREWFKAGTMPAGLPSVEAAPAGLERAELEIFIFGKSGAPTTWTAPK